MAEDGRWLRRGGTEKRENCVKRIKVSDNLSSIEKDEWKLIGILRVGVPDKKLLEHERFYINFKSSLIFHGVGGRKSPVKCLGQKKININ